MKLPVLVCLVMPAAVCAQTDTAIHLVPVKHHVYEQYMTIATLSLGFVDEYRSNYSLPANYAKNNTSGFAPIYAKLEYGAGRHLSLAATFAYDAFLYNYSQYYQWSNETLSRYRTDNMRIFSGGLAAFYHFNDLIRIRHLDPFAGFGLSLNNIRHGAYPLGDSTIVKLDHTVSYYLKGGVRYYISSRFSLYGDVGYDQHTAFSIGASCRFMKDKFRGEAGREDAPGIADSGADLRTTTLPVDSDGDGIPDKDDSCPHQAGLTQFNGCPDSDGDGIPDIEDACPFAAGPADNHGCPVQARGNAPEIHIEHPVKANHGGPVDNSLDHLVEQYVIPVNTIQFELGSTVVKQSSYPSLNAVAEKLRHNPEMNALIDGYADITGTPAVNARISKNRAEAVKKYIVGKGISPARVITAGHGSKDPAANNHTRAGRAKNRRATIIIIPR